MKSQNNFSEGTTLGIAENLYRLLKDNFPEATVNEILGYLGDKLKSGSGPVSVTTAVEINEEEKQKIIKAVARLTEQEREVIFGVNPDIIGGLIINTGERVYDQSIKSGLNQLSDKITK